MIRFTYSEHLCRNPNSCHRILLSLGKQGGIVMRTASMTQLVAEQALFPPRKFGGKISLSSRDALTVVEIRKPENSDLNN